MDGWVGKVAIVTGASSGIGAAIAEELVKAGVLVVGLARRWERLENLAESLKESRGKFYPRRCDLRKEEDILSAFEWVNSELGGVDILVNNAGVGNCSNVIDDDTDSLSKILDVNVLAVAIAIREAVASMKSRDVAAGYIININSTFGHGSSTMPRVSLYTSSKCAVTALTETVRRELAAEGKNNIKITSLSPGFTKTEIFEVSGIPDTLLSSIPTLDPRDIADAVLYLLGTQHKVHVTELTMRHASEVA